MGMSELLIATTLDARQHEWVSGIRSAGGQLLGLLDDALDMAGIEAGQLQLHCQDFALDSLLAEVLSPARERAQARGLQLQAPEGLPGQIVVQGDRVRLRQVLNNLLLNAIRHTPSGEVGLRVTLDSLGRSLGLEVHDTGPGLSALHQQQVFERFSGQDNAVARVAGGGVGLAISRELVMAMGGSIHYRSLPAGGNCIAVQLPLRWRLEASPAEAGVVEAGGQRTALRVLLVEDDPAVADVIGALLQARGHQVSHALNGLQALSLVVTEQFDVGLLDLDLPGLDGLGLARQIRAMGMALPLLAVTARADADAESQVRQAGFDAYVRKPVTGVLLAEALVQMMRERPARMKGEPV